MPSNLYNVTADPKTGQAKVELDLPKQWAKPKQEPTDRTPTKQPPSTQPPAKPLEDATKRLLDNLLKDRKKSDRPAPKKR